MSRLRCRKELIKFETIDKSSTVFYFGSIVLIEKNQRITVIRDFAQLGEEAASYTCAENRSASFEADE